MEPPSWVGSFMNAPRADRRTQIEKDTNNSAAIDVLDFWQSANRLQIIGLLFKTPRPMVLQPEIRFN